MKKILLIEGSSNIGGGQIMSAQIAKSLCEIYSIEIFCPYNINEDYINLFPKDIHFHTYKTYTYNRGKKTFLDYVKFAYSFITIISNLIKIIHKEKIDLLYIQHPLLIPHATIASTILNKPSIVHIHVVHTDKRICRFIDFCLSCNCHKKIIGVSSYSLKQFKRIKGKTAIIYNCITKLSPLKNINYRKNISIAVIGDISPQKGQDILIRALNSTNFTNNIDVYFAGNIIDENYKKNIIDSTNLKVHFLGRINNIDDFLNNIDLVIIPSLNETFSLAMVEAWEKGIYTIASDLGGMHELVHTFLPEYQKNLLFQKNNHTDLRHKIENFIGLSIENRNHIIQLAQQVAKNEFSVESFTKRIRMHIKSVIEN